MKVEPIDVDKALESIDKGIKYCEEIMKDPSIAATDRIDAARILSDLAILRLKVVVEAQERLKKDRLRRITKND